MYFTVVVFASSQEYILPTKGGDFAAIKRTQKFMSTWRTKHQEVERIHAFIGGIHFLSLVDLGGVDMAQCVHIRGQKWKAPR
ncbi:hypothetical protein EYZ11_007745 [Aspergillus tanneri]|uniref:Uncharacterized protein n=1 Tax=Aspergillus tanneri TaxID=1220188 RepID=A0A4V3UNW4_9EURO|nr:hypothetical protein EYZ11_007745 [Aspergillus tanneri]